MKWLVRLWRKLFRPKTFRITSYRAGPIPPSAAMALVAYVESEQFTNLSLLHPPRLDIEP